MKWLVLGATGLLGPHFMHTIRARSDEAISAARSDADIALDIVDDFALLDALEDIQPDGVVNCAANIFVDKCEEDPSAAYMVNTRPLGFLARWSKDNQKPLLQISTDHYFVEGGNRKQSETEPVTLVNEYARTKYLAEQLALTSPHALVLRTNIIGAQKGHGKWTRDSLLNRSPMTLFMDFFASPLHVEDMARISMDLASANANGVYNVASSDVSSKGEFIYAVAKALNVDPDWVIEGSGLSLKTPRAMCLGLDVSKAETMLGYKLPGLTETAIKLAKEIVA